MTSVNVEGSAYRGINVVGLIGDPRRSVKVTFAIIYAKDYALLAACHETAPGQQLFLTLLFLVSQGPDLHL